MRALPASAVALALGALVLAFLWHISVGARAVPLAEVARALVRPDPALFDHVVVRDLRLPRAIFAASVGAALAVSGALLQGVTRNPLADPGILGLMAGASFAVVVGIGWLRLADTAWLPAVAAVGALGGAALVWGIAAAAPGGMTPLTLVLSGAAVTAFLGAIDAALILLNEEVFGSLRVWLSGSLAGRSMETYLWALPWFLAGLGLGLLIARQVTALAMGEETGVGLGVEVGRVKLAALASVVALTAAAISVAGPLGFVGLVIPHVARLLCGSDYRVLVPVSAVLGALYLLLVDIAARVALAPIEVSTGIVTAMIGGPFFVWLVWARL